MRTGCSDFVHVRSGMTIDLCIPTMPGRRTAGFQRPGRHGVNQARSAASRMKGGRGGGEQKKEGEGVAVTALKLRQKVHRLHVYNRNKGYCEGCRGASFTSWNTALHRRVGAVESDDAQQPHCSHHPMLDPMLDPLLACTRCQVPGMLVCLRDTNFLVG